MFILFVICLQFYISLFYWEWVSQLLLFFFCEMGDVWILTNSAHVLQHVPRRFRLANRLWGLISPLSAGTLISLFLAEKIREAQLGFLFFLSPFLLSCTRGTFILLHLVCRPHTFRGKGVSDVMRAVFASNNSLQQHLLSVQGIVVLKIFWGQFWEMKWAWETR